MGPTPILEMARAYGLRPRLWLLFLIQFPPSRPHKNYLQNDSNFQAVAHIQIILQKPNTNLATEMRKMTLTPVTFSFLPTLPLPHRNVHLLTVTQSV